MGKLGSLEAIGRLFGAHDLKFGWDKWSLSIEESYEREGDAPIAQRTLFLEGTFENWPLWKLRAKARLVSRRIDKPNPDAIGRPSCGYICWSKGYDSSSDDATKWGEIDGFENGSVEVRSVITPETFDNILMLLQVGKTWAFLRKTWPGPWISFRLSTAPPEHWDGSDPLSLSEVHFFDAGFDWQAEFDRNKAEKGRRDGSGD